MPPPAPLNVGLQRPELRQPTGKRPRRDAKVALRRGRDDSAPALSPSHLNTCARFRGLALVCLCACGGASADLSEYLAAHDGGGVAASSSGGAGTDSSSGDDGAPTDDGAADGTGDDTHSADPPSPEGGSGDGSDATTSDGAGDDGQGYDATIPDEASNTGDAGPVDGGSHPDGAPDAGSDASCGEITATLGLLPSSCSSCLQAACGASISFCLGTGCNECVAGVQVCETASCATECLADAAPPIDAAYLDAVAVDAASPCTQVAPCCYFYVLDGPVTLASECNTAVQANDVATCSAVLAQAQAIGLCL
jgi:hypothetical protein